MAINEYPIYINNIIIDPANIININHVLDHVDMDLSTITLPINPKNGGTPPKVIIINSIVTFSYIFMFHSAGINESPAWNNIIANPIKIDM